MKRRKEKLKKIVAQDREEGINNYLGSLILKKLM